MYSPAGKAKSKEQTNREQTNREQTKGISNKRISIISAYFEMSRFEPGVPWPVPLSWMNPIGAVTTVPVDWLTGEEW